MHETLHPEIIFCNKKQKINTLSMVTIFQDKNDE